MPLNSFPAVVFTLAMALPYWLESSASEQKQQEYSLPNSWSHSEERIYRLEQNQNKTPEDNRLYQDILAGYQSPDSYWWDHIKVITWGRKP